MESAASEHPMRRNSTLGHCICDVLDYTIQMIRSSTLWNRGERSKVSDTNGTNLGCLCEPRALAVGLRRILTTFSWPTASARGSKPVPFVSDTFLASLICSNRMSWQRFPVWLATGPGRRRSRGHGMLMGIRLDPTRVQQFIRGDTVFWNEVKVPRRRQFLPSRLLSSSTEYPSICPVIGQVPENGILNSMRLVDSPSLQRLVVRLQPRRTSAELWHSRDTTLPCIRSRNSRPRRLSSLRRLSCADAAGRLLPPGR